MNEELLNNIWEVLSSDGATDSDFETWKQNFQADEEIQVNVHEYLTENQYTESDYETWSTNVGIKKKDNSQPTGEEEVMVSDTEVVEQPGSSVPSATSSEQPEVIQEEVTTESSNIIDPNEVVDETEDGASYINLEGGGDDDDLLANATMGEQDTAIERALGKNEFTDFFGDMWRAGSQGQAQGDVVDNALEIFGKGTSASDQDIEEFIIAHNAMAAAGPSDEMKDFDRVYEAAGGGIFGFLKGLIESPTLAPQLFVSSMSAMVNPASLAAAGATTAGFAGVGSMAGGIGAIPGAVLSIPFAMGAAGATLETGLSFAEFLNEELKEKGLKFTKEDVKKVLNDPEAMIRIRAKAAGRGAVIGIIDRYTAGLGGKLVGGMVKSGAKKGARILAAAGVEAAGGSAGEAAARLAVGQEMDIKEIGFEGIAGMSTTPVTYAYGTLLAKPVFKVNDGVVDRATMLEMINTPDDKAFAGMELEIKNDPELLAIAEARKTKLRQESGISKQLKEAGITDEAAITELTALEREKQALEGNTTRAGKLKLKEIDAKIDAVMEGKVVQEIEVTTEEARKSLEADNELVAISKKKGMPIGETVLLSQENIENRRQELLLEKQESNITEETTTQDVEVIEDKVTPESERLAALEETLEGKDLEVLQLMRDKNKSQEMINNHIKNKAKNTGKGNQLSIKFKAEDTLLNPEGKSLAELVSAYAVIFESKNLPAKTIQDALFTDPDLRTKNLGAGVPRYAIQQAILNFESYQNKNNNQKTKQDAIQESSTESVDVQERTTDSKEVGDGNTQGDITQESIESEADTETQSQEEIDTESRDLESFLNDNDVVVEETETTVDATESRPLKERIKNIVDKIADAKNGFAKKWFNPSVMERAGITTDEDVREYYIQSLENGEVINDTNKEFLNSEFKRLGIDPDNIQNTTITEAVTTDNNGNLNIIESMKGSQVTLPGQKVNNTLSITDKTTTENDSHYSSDIFTQENPNATVEQHESKILKLANKAVKAIAKLLPNTKIVIHRSEAAYNKFVTGKGTRGTFDPNTNTIHINMPKANAKTIAHEIFHAVLYDRFGSDIKIAEVTKRMVDAVKRKVTDKKLKQKLDDFSEQYTEFQNEEYLSELVGILADNYPSLSTPEKSLVKRWLQKVAKMLKIDALIDTDADVLDLLNTIGKSVKEGKEITATEVKQLDMFEGGQQVDNPSAALKEQKIGNFEVTYTQQEKIEEYIKDGRITQPEDLSFLEGMMTTITSPDDMMAGELKYKNKVIFEGEGGVFFVTKFGEVWASGKIGTANTIKNSLNKQIESGQKKGYLVLTKGTDSKLVSSASGVNSTLEVLNLMLDEKLISPSLFRSSVTESINKEQAAVIKQAKAKAKKNKQKYIPIVDKPVNLRSSAKDLKADIKKFFTDPTTSTFMTRGNIVKNINSSIINGVKAMKDKEKIRAIAKFIGGDEARPVGVNTSKIVSGTQGLTDLLATLVAEKLTKGLNIGDVYAVIEVDGKVDVIPSSHPSYPFHVVQLNKKKPKLILPKNREAGKDLFKPTYGKDEKTGESLNNPYSITAVSVVDGVFEKQDTKVTDTDVITQEDVKILYPKQRQQKVDVTEEQVQEALQTDKTAQRIIAKGIKPKQGENVGIRLNLNVFKNTGVPVQSIHKGTKTDAFKKVDGTSGNFRGEVINYAPAVTLKDVYLNTHQKSIYEVKNKIKNKFPLASVDGKFQDVPFNKQNLKGTELRFNPFNTQLFETMDGKPVRFVEEATVSGTRVFARGKIDYFTEANKPKPYTPEKSTKQRQQLPDGYFVQETGKGEFTLMKENRRAGEMSIAELQSDKPSVSQVYLRPTDKGLGLAPDMYREIAKAMESKGKTLVSSMYTNNASQGVWKRLVKDGDAEVIGSRIDAEGKFRNMYSFIPSKPKQRQQKVVFNVEKQRVYKDNSSGVTFLTKGYGGTFINIPRKAITIKDINGLSESQKPLVEVTMERDVYNKQDQARKVVDGKESFVNELENIRGFKKIRLIQDSPTKNNLQRVTSLAQQSGIKENNFLPGTLSNPQALNTRLKELGYSLKTYGNPSKPYGYGILKPDGKLFTMSKQRQQVSDVLNKDMSAVEIINVARANNFRGPAIKDYLVRVKKMKVKEVDALLKIPLTMFSSIPEAFTNIKEGMNEGIKFYTDILKKTVTWQIKNKATDAQAFDKAVQLLEESKIFQNQADKNRKSLSTLQKEMIVGMQKSLGVRPMKNTNLKLRVLRQSLKDTKRGAKELKSVQSKLRNFIRRSLPKKLYTKGEITTLISDVTNATEANIDNLIQKVIDKITTIQVADLESTIQKLMDDNYEKIESGREKGKKIIVDVNDRLKALKKDMVTDSMVADDVVKRNLELNQEFNEITNKSEQLSEGDLNRLMDLAVLINLNNATLMNNTDVNKVESLNKAAELLTQIVGKGKELFKAQLKKDHQKYLKNKETLYEQVTGEKIDMSDPEQVAKAKKAEAKGKARKNKRESDGLLKKSVRGLQLAMSSFFKGSESLSGLMNIIDRLPGELIGGKVRKMVYGLLNESTRVYKARKKGNKQIIETKLKEIFGKKWKSGISAMRKPIDWSATKDIFIDEKEVNEAKKLVEENPTRENKKNLKKVIEENTLVMSQDEILYQYQQFQDPANLASFMNENNFLYRGDPKRILESLMEQVDPKNKEVADWMVEEFYPSLYEHYNKTYKAIYRTNLPWNDKYAGRIYREASAPNPLDLLGTDVKSNNQVSAASTKVRRMNDKPIVKMGMMDVMMTYTTDMEWFASHAEAIRDINKMFDDPLIAQAIEQNNGEGTLLLIRDSIQKIARRGINNAARGKFMNAVNNMFIAARLGANPTIFLKQMTSFITYANDIGIVNYMKYAAVNKTQALKVYKEIWNNSVYVQDRASERIQDVLESYTSLGNVEFSTKENYITKLMMSPVKYGDLGAIFLGGSPNYSFYKAEFQKKNPKATEQQAIDYAIRKFENDTKNTQQSSDLQDKDYYQTADPVVRAFNMFLTTPKQYLRKEFGAMRNLYRKLAAWDRKAGQGTVGENIRQLAMYHFVMPLFFQFVAMGFPDLGDLEDEEKEDLLRAGILGNFNALFIAGDVLTMIADAVQEKPWAGTTKSLAPLNVMSEIANLYTRAEKTKDPVKKAELTQKMILRITEVSLTPTGKNLPLVNIAKYVKNLNELGEGGSEKDFKRLFNYSKYVIDKEGKDKGTKLSKKEMQLYFPDLYEQEMALDKELKELNKELELDF